MSQAMVKVGDRHCKSSNAKGKHCKSILSDGKGNGIDKQ